MHGIPWTSCEEGLIREYYEGRLSLNTMICSTVEQQVLFTNEGKSWG
jgi:hypothetical protein